MRFKKGDEMNRDEKHLMDDRLQSAAQQAMRSVVKGLPEETVSMTWRSELNERLLVESAQRARRPRVAWYMRPALGLGLAGALAVAVLLRGPGVSPTVSPNNLSSSGRLEAELVSTHRQASFAMDVAGVGVNPTEVSYDSTPVQRSSSGWTEEDLDTL